FSGKNVPNLIEADWTPRKIGGPGNPPARFWVLFARTKSTPPVGAGTHKGCTRKHCPLRRHGAKKVLIISKQKRRNSLWQKSSASAFGAARKTTILTPGGSR